MLETTGFRPLNNRAYQYEQIPFPGIVVNHMDGSVPTGKLVTSKLQEGNRLFYTDGEFSSIVHSGQ